MIKQQAELGTTTIYVTHDQVEAMMMGDRICIMNRGEVVQIGRPLEVYRNPVDTFVARFLGNPPMNLLSGAIEIQSERVMLHVAGSKFELPVQPTPELGKYAGSAVIVGIRPEDLYDASPAGPRTRWAQMPARVTAVEPLGAETLLMLAPPDSKEESIARVGRETALRTGDQATLAVDVTAIHLFDPATNRAIPCSRRVVTPP